MPGVSLNVKHQLGSVIKRFRFEELEDAVLPVFPELSWSQIKSRLVMNHESLTTPHAIKIIEEQIKDARLPENELKDRLATLEVIDVSRHYKRKIWYCHEFKGKNAPKNLTPHEIQTLITDSFHVHQMEVDVRVVESKDITFLSIRDRPRKKKMKTILPTYFSLIKNENFFFCSKKMVSKSALVAITDGMGYQSCKQIKLIGRDISSLIKMLLTRKTAAAEGNIFKKSVRFRQAPPTLTSLGLDFTQHKQRRKYAETCFGENPPTFEFLRVKSLDQKWKDKDIHNSLPEDQIYTGIEFRSTNIPNFLKNLVMQQILMTPLPCYAASILSVARNDLTLKEN